MSGEYEEKDVYVLLDFKGKDLSRLLKQHSIYFRMYNLNESKPIVEIDQDVYEGVYDDAVGTNVYFEEIDDPPPKSNIFEGSTPITLQYLLKQTKLLKLNKIGTKPKPVISAAPTERVNIVIKDDYRILLEKYMNHKLNIDDYVVDETENKESEESPLSDKSDEEEQEPEIPVKKQVRWDTFRQPPSQDLLPNWYTTAIKSGDEARSNPIYNKYLKLQKLAERPTSHKTEEEHFKSDEFTYGPKALNNFMIWKTLALKRMEEQPIKLDVNVRNVEDFVDVEKSIEMGVIDPSDAEARVFTKAEKEKLLSFENFFNLLPLMKLVFIQHVIRAEKATILKIPKELMDKVDENDGLTCMQRLKLLQNFKEELHNQIVVRLQDAQNNDPSLQKLGEITLNLSDNELSDLDSGTSSDESANDLMEDEKLASEENGSSSGNDNSKH